MKESGLLDDEKVVMALKSDLKQKKRAKTVPNKTEVTKESTKKKGLFESKRRWTSKTRFTTFNWRILRRSWTK